MKIKKVISKSEFQLAVESAKSNPFNVVRAKVKLPLVMVSGIPHKMKNGSLVPLMKLS